MEPLQVFIVSDCGANVNLILDMAKSCVRISALMKLLAFLMLFSFMVSAPVAEAQWSNGSGRELSAKEKRKQDKQEAKAARKEAAQYYKEYIVKKRKSLILVKKIEDERSREASVRSFKMLYEEEEDVADDQMGRGRVIGGGSNRGRGASVSDGAKSKAMEAERKKYEKQIKKIDTQIEAEQTRIEEAELMTDELKSFIEQALK